MLSKAHLTSHSRMSGSRWVITPLWLSGLKIFFVQFFHVFLPPFLNIFCFCYIPTILSFIVLIFAWNIPLASLIFLKRSLVFSILLFSSISLHWSLRKAFLSLLAILWNSAFKWVYLSFSRLFFSQLFLRPLQTTILLFAFVFSLGIFLISVSCTMSWFSIHSSSGTLSDLGKKNNNKHLNYNFGRGTTQKFFWRYIKIISYIIQKSDGTIYLCHWRYWHDQLGH